METLDRKYIGLKRHFYQEMNIWKSSHVSNVTRSRFVRIIYHMSKAYVNEQNIQKERLFLCENKHYFTTVCACKMGNKYISYICKWWNWYFKNKNGEYFIVLRMLPEKLFMHYSPVVPWMLMVCICDISPNWYFKTTKTALDSAKIALPKKCM